MKVVFLAPHYPPEMLQYTRGLAEVGATVFGIGDQPAAALPHELKPYLADYLHVPRIMDEDDVVARAHAWLRGRSVDRILANWEPLVLTAAKMRDRFGVPGMTYDTVQGFRDKQLMKERVASAGLRVPKSQRVRTITEAKKAAAEYGYPLIVKPIAGAGSADTYKVESDAELDRVLSAMQHIAEASVEEYIDGEEFTFDTVSLGGVPLYQNVAQYLPKPIVARSVEWLSPIIITVKNLDQPKLEGGLELGKKVLKALRMGDGFTHAEWFLKPNGEAVFGEIGCRPGGARLVDQMNYTSDVDLFREWARVVCWGRFEGDTTRKYNTAIIFKRAKGQGRITRIDGLNEFMRQYGEHVVEQKLLPVGTHRRDWKQTLLSDGHIILRHPDWSRTKELADIAASQITLHAQ
jgi:biotin carboxylase